MIHAALHRDVHAISAGLLCRKAVEAVRRVEEVVVLPLVEDPRIELVAEAPP
jgi:hypothetical protein